MLRLTYTSIELVVPRQRGTLKSEPQKETIYYITVWADEQLENS